MAAITICSDLGAPQNKVWHCFHCFPIYFPWSDGTGCHDLRFWRQGFKPAFSLFSLTFIKRLLTSLLSAIRVVSSAYLRLLLFLPVILIPACSSSSPAFLMIITALIGSEKSWHSPWVYLSVLISGVPGRGPRNKYSIFLHDLLLKFCIKIKCVKI